MKIPFDLLQFLALIVQLSIGLNAAIFDDSKELPAVSIRLCDEAHGGGIQARVESLERVWRAGCFPGGGAVCAGRGGVCELVPGTRARAGDSPGSAAHGYLLTVYCAVTPGTTGQAARGVPWCIGGHRAMGAMPLPWMPRRMPKRRLAARGSQDQLRRRECQCWFGNVSVVHVELLC